MGRMLLSKPAKGLSRLHNVFAKNEANLVMVFTPEHGLTAQEDEHGNSTKAAFYVQTIYRTSVKKMSAYFKGCEVMVYDLPDVGVRPFTYRTIFTRSLRAMNEVFKKDARAKFIFIDVPNLAAHLGTRGPVAQKFSYFGEEKIAIFPGYTYGELARRYHHVNKINVPLEIIKLKDYNKEHFLISGYQYYQPSPNLPTFRSVECYWMSVFLEGTYLDMGRNSNDPFCLIGHPDLRETHPPPTLPGIRWSFYTYKPWGGPYKGRLLKSFRMRVLDPNQYKPIETAYAIYAHLKKSYSKIKTFRVTKNKHYRLDSLIGTKSWRLAIKKNQSFNEWMSGEQAKLNAFRKEMIRFKVY